MNISEGKGKLTNKTVWHFHNDQNFMLAKGCLNLITHLKRGTKFIKAIDLLIMCHTFKLIHFGFFDHVWLRKQLLVSLKSYFRAFVVILMLLNGFIKASFKSINLVKRLPLKWQSYIFFKKMVLSRHYKKIPIIFCKSFENTFKAKKPTRLSLIYITVSPIFKLW